MSTFKEPRYNSVTTLVVCHCPSLFFSNDLLFLDATDDSFRSHLEIYTLDIGLVLPCREDSSFVADVVDICTTEPRGQRSEALRVFFYRLVVRQFDWFEMS